MLYFYSMAFVETNYVVTNWNRMWILLCWKTDNLDVLIELMCLPPCEFHYIGDTKGLHEYFISFWNIPHRSVANFSNCALIHVIIVIMLQRHKWINHFGEHTLITTKDIGGKASTSRGTLRMRFGPIKEKGEQRSENM